MVGQFNAAMEPDGDQAGTVNRGRAGVKRRGTGFLFLHLLFHLNPGMPVVQRVFN